jgi:hypothetical protein
MNVDEKVHELGLELAEPFRSPTEGTFTRRRGTDDFTVSEVGNRDDPTWDCL